MDEKLQRLMQHLGQAINDSLSDSDAIAEAIGEIRGEGYDVYLVLEATIGFNRRDAEAGAKSEQPVSSTPLNLSFSKQDQEFLRDLKITVEE